MATLFPFLQKLRPGQIRFAYEDDVGQVLELFRLDGRHRTSDDSHDTTSADFLENLVQPLRLHAHAREADHVGAAKPLEINCLDILVDQGHLVVARHERGQQ